MLYILTDLVFIFLPICTVNPGESWHRKSHVYPEEVFIENAMSTL